MADNKPKPKSDKIPPRQKPKKQREIGDRFWNDKPTKENPLG